MNNIQSNTQVASSSSDTISASANSLQEKEISKDTESNITAKGNSITAYETSQTQKSADIVNIGLHFFLKNVRPYAASCSEA